MREVKFKLEDRLIRKALKQLKSGLELLVNSVPSAEVDRLEIVLPLKERHLKKPELSFLGAQLCFNRYELKYDGNTFLENQNGNLIGVTVVLL